MFASGKPMRSIFPCSDRFSGSLAWNSANLTLDEPPLIVRTLDGSGFIVARLIFSEPSPRPSPIRWERVAGGRVRVREWVWERDGVRVRTSRDRQCDRWSHPPPGGLPEFLD